MLIRIPVRYAGRLIAKQLLINRVGQYYFIIHLLSINNDISVDQPYAMAIIHVPIHVTGV